MRINAERERIKKFQDITKGSAYTYYKILKRITEDAKPKQDENGHPKENKDPQIKMKLAMKEAQN